MDEKLRILLCEDDENLGMLLREYLQAKGYAVELCPDGEAGYKAFLKNKYDLCVFDVMMPKKDGFTLAQEVRAANAEIPIIFLTAKTLKEDILEGFGGYSGRFQNRCGRLHHQAFQHGGTDFPHRGYLASRAWQEEQTEQHLQDRQVYVRHSETDTLHSGEIH